MLKTNSKQAKENIKNYIINHFDFSNYETEESKAPKSYKDICKCIFETMKAEKFYSHSINNFETFEDWCQGLPSLIDTCYYYNRSAIEDLKIILKETEAEASKFTEKQAAKKLTYLIYREVTKNM